MASEDSDKLMTGFSPIHRLSDRCDLDTTILREMEPVVHELQAHDEFLEIVSLCRFQRMLPEKGTIRSRKSDRLATMYWHRCSL